MKEVLEKIKEEKALILPRLESRNTTYEEMTQEMSHYVAMIKEDEESIRRFNSIIEFLEKYIKEEYQLAR